MKVYPHRLKSYLVQCRSCDCFRSVSYDQLQYCKRVSNRCKSCAKKGKTLSEEHKASISLSVLSGEDSPEWKGDDVSYNGLHKRVSKHWGTPALCEHCGLKSKKTKDGRNYIQWANKSGKYTFCRDDWMQLCTKCHKLYDITKIKC